MIIDGIVEFYSIIVAHAGKQTASDPSAKTDCQGSSPRGQSHVPHLCMHLHHARDVRDPHRFQRGVLHMDEPHTGSCEQVGSVLL